MCLCLKGNPVLFQNAMPRGSGRCDEKNTRTNGFSQCRLKEPTSSPVFCTLRLKETDGQPTPRPFPLPKATRSISVGSVHATARCEKSGFTLGPAHQSASPANPCHPLHRLQTPENPHSVQSCLCLERGSCPVSKNKIYKGKST